jgi:alpha-glucosidase
VPRHGGADVVATMRSFGAHMSWRSRAHSWTLLGSHDTARIRSVVGDPARMDVAVGLLMTLPGVPMVFAGDEIGLEGVNGEDARRPMPWHRPEAWRNSTLDSYRTLIRHRRGSSALRHGGLRWAYVDDDAIVYLRESVDETLLVCARRAPGDEVCLRDLPGSAENIYGGADAMVDPDGSLRVPGDGPTIQIWRLH